MKNYANTLPRCGGKQLCSFNTLLQPLRRNRFLICQCSTKTNILSTSCTLAFTLTHKQTSGWQDRQKIAQPLLLGKANFRKQHTHINISHMKDGINEHFLLPSSFLTLLDRLSNLVPSKTNLLLFHFIQINSFAWMN